MESYDIPAGWNRGELLAYQKTGYAYTFYRAHPIVTNDAHHIVAGNTATMELSDSIAAQNFMGWWYDKSHS